MSQRVISRDQAIAAGHRISSPTALGLLLRSRRKKLGYTQEAAAAMLGYSPRLVGEIERGRGSVGFEKILAYASGLGIDLVAFER